MRPEFKVLEWIDKYLEGRLEGEELAIFEERLLTDASFAREVAEHRDFVKELKFYGKRQSIKNKLNSFHAKLEPATNTVPAAASAPTRSKGETVFNIFRTKYFPMIGVAASVALISVFSTLFAIDYMRSVEESQQSNYRYLKREVDNLKKSHNAIKEGISAAITVTPAPKSLKYGGTGFALSSDGYVVTSYHLVSKADSIIIEDNTDTRQTYKAQIVYSDENRDLAVLKVVNEDFKSFGRLPYTFNTKAAELGEDIYTLAYPREDIVYGQGSISSKTGYQGDFDAYQVSIPVNPGNSGGPVFNAAGNVVGIISGKQAESEGVAFAMKSEALLKMLKEMPQDSSSPSIKLPQGNRLSKLRRTEQLRRIEDFVFNVKVY
jgi:serine protease Do